MMHEHESPEQVQSAEFHMNDLAMLNNNLTEYRPLDMNECQQSF